MNRLHSLSSSRHLFLTAFLFMGLLSSFGAPESIVAQNCIEVVEHSFTCESVLNAPTPVYRLKVLLKNRSNFTGNRIHIAVTNAQGKSLGSYLVGTFIPPGEIDETETFIAGAMPGERVRARIMVSEGYQIPSSPKTCQGDFEFTLPNCPRAQGYDCLEPLDIRVQCIENSINHVRVSLKIRNHTGLTLKWVDIGALHPNNIGGGTGYFTLSYLQPGQTSAVITTQGIPRSTDSYLILYMSATGDSLVSLDPFDIHQKQCVTKLWVDVSHCPINGSAGFGSPSKGFALANSVVECDSTGWAWCFNVQNLSKKSLTSMSFENSSLNLNGDRQFDRPVPPGGLSEKICLFLPSGQNGFQPPDGYMNLKMRTDSANLVYHDSVKLTIPHCSVTEEKCCDGFIMNFASTIPVAAPNGLTGLLGLTGAGPNPITKVSATIVSAAVNSQSASAYFNSGTILNPLGAGTQTPSQFGEELIWTSGAGVPMNAPSLFLNWLRMPPMAPNARRDTVSFCVRWRFTDVNCHTCDTLICYRTVRNQFFFDNTRIDREKSNALLGQGGNLSGQLTGHSSGTMKISFPELPAEHFGEVTFKGLKIQSGESARISAIVSDFPLVTFSTHHGLATSIFNARAGDDLGLTINYEGLEGRASLNHFILLSYESSLLPGIEQQIPLSVTLRQDGIATGGDQVDAVNVEIPGSEIVQTFALHLRNANTTAEPLSGLRIVAGEGVKLLAVGPTSSETGALLRFGAEGDGGHAYISEAPEGTVSLAPESERNPIYVTVAMNEEADPMIRYATLNGLNEVVTEGELYLSQISSTHGDGVTGTSVSLGQSVPNPTTGEVAFGLRLTSTERASLVIRDVSGREVMRLMENELLTPGTHVVTADVSGLSSGTYFYTLETATGSETRKMVIEK